MTTDIIAWLQSNPRGVKVPLFEVGENGVVLTKVIEKSGRTLLQRNKLMEEAMITLIEHHINDPLWEGLLYIMVWDDSQTIIPLYVGKAEKKGTKNNLSANIANIAQNKHKFARWGDGLDYHIGDLSHTIYEFSTDRKPKKKYKRWAETLFFPGDPPILRHPVSLVLIPWFEDNIGPVGMSCSLPIAEKQVIMLADEQFSEFLLNIDGK